LLRGQRRVFTGGLTCISMICRGRTSDLNESRTGDADGRMIFAKAYDLGSYGLLCWFTGLREGRTSLEKNFAGF